jgi:hypothetical protein
MTLSPYVLSCFIMHHTPGSDIKTQLWTNLPLWPREQRTPCLRPNSYYAVVLSYDDPPPW